MIILPKFVSLDTSTITKLARDFFGDDPAKKSEVIAVRDGLRDEGWFVTLTSDHLLELAQHSNDEVVLSRFKFLRTFENLAWIWSVEKNGIGSILDIDCFEIRVFVAKGIISKQEIIKHVKQELFVVGSGNELFGDNYNEWLQLADASKPGLAKSQSTVSILRTEPVKGVNGMKLREFLGAQYEDSDDIPNIVGRLAGVMAKQIDEHGDKRVCNSENLARTFYQQTLQHIDEIKFTQTNLNDEMELIHGVAKTFGIPASVVDLDMTVGQLGDLGHFSMMLEIYSRKLGGSKRLTMEDVKASDLPSWSLRLRLRDFQNQAKRVSGSDIGDRSLACLIPYLHSCEVDKRTKDYLRRFASQRDSNFDYLNHSFKCGDYRRILKSLPDASNS